MTDDLYGPLRLVGGMVAVAIYAAVTWQTFTFLQGSRTNAAAMREFLFSAVALFAGVAFLIGAFSIIAPAATPIVRFANSLILGFLIAVGLHLLATMSRGRARRH